MLAAQVNLKHLNFLFVVLSQIEVRKLFSQHTYPNMASKIAKILGSGFSLRKRLNMLRMWENLLGIIIYWGLPTVSMMIYLINQDCAKHKNFVIA